MATTTQNTPQNTRNERGPSEWVLAFFTSPLFMMAALGLALLAQGKHTADVFAYWSHRNTPEWLFYAFAGGVEIAVFIFVLHDHKRTSYAFAVGAFATNVVYYAIGGANLLSPELFPVLLLSVLLPGVIVGYSHTIAEKPKTTDAAPSKPAKPAKVRRYFWQFWRPRPAATAATNTSQRDHQTAAESTRGMETALDNTGSEMGAPSGAPVGTTQASDDEGKPSTADKLTPKQRQEIIKIRGYQTTAEVMQAFGIKERAANGDLAEVRKSVLHRNGVAK